MTEQELLRLKDWFFKYARSFQQGPAIERRNFTLKEEHTLRVCRDILTIGQQIGLQPHQRLLAEAIALFHDIGRFEQYDRYKTFADSRSEDHANLGLTVIARHDVLAGCDPAVQHILRQAIKYHNRAALPPEEKAEWILYARLLRDADKLDIWRVVTEYYHRCDHERNQTIELDLPDTPGVSAQVVQDLAAKHIVYVQHLKNLNDFKLLQMGWIYDINFMPTYQLIRERGYLEKIRGVLPAGDEIDALYAQMLQHLSDSGMHR